MAFQTGTKVDPRLMQADYSGFTNAANIRANAMANLGSKIGSIIEDYKKDKEDKIQKENFAAALMPYATKMTGGDAAEAKKIVNLFANKPENAAVVMQFMQLGQEQEAAAQQQRTLEALGRGDISAQEAFTMGVSPEAIKDYTDVTEGMDAKKFAESVALAAESVNGTYDPGQRAIVVDESMIPFYGEKSIPLSDPMFEPYFATAKGQTMTDRGFDVLGTFDSPTVQQEEYVPKAPVSLQEAQNSSAGIGSSLSSMSAMNRPDAATSIMQSAQAPMFVEPSLNASDVASGAVSRMSDFFKRKLKENQAMRQSTYGL
jgi:hypothetical protein